MVSNWIVWCIYYFFSEDNILPCRLKNKICYKQSVYVIMFHVAGLSKFKELQCSVVSNPLNTLPLIVTITFFKYFLASEQGSKCHSTNDGHYTSSVLRHHCSFFILSIIEMYGCSTGLLVTSQLVNNIADPGATSQSPLSDKHILNFSERNRGKRLRFAGSHIFLVSLSQH